MALNYLNGQEQPTAAKMNELWAEADSVLDKALQGGSTYLLETIGASSTPSSHPDSKLYRGKEFVFWGGADHGATSNSVLHSAFENIPSTYDQSTYDTAAANATISTWYSSGAVRYAHVAGSSTPNLVRSLKAHTRTNGGQEYYIWEYDQPAPEKKWKYAVAEILIGVATTVGGGAGGWYKFEMPNTYDKYSFFRISNLTSNDVVFFFGTSADSEYSLTIPKHGQICVRRVVLPNDEYEFHKDYKYFFKCLPNDPRFLSFDSFDGSIAQSMRANNITNPSYLYNLFEFVGMDNSPVELSNIVGTGSAGNGMTIRHQRIYFNPTTKLDIGTEMAADGYFPAITDSTKVGDIVYHKGKIGYRKKDTSGSTLSVGEIDFDGWDSFNTKLAAIDATIEASAVTNNDDTKIKTNATPHELKIWPISTNVLQLDDINAALHLHDTEYLLQTHLLRPPQHATAPRYYNRYFHNLDSFASGGANPTNSSGDRYNARTSTVTNLKNQLSDATHYLLNSDHSTTNRSVVLTSEGPFLFWRDKFAINNTNTSSNQFGWFGGFTTNHAMRIEEISGDPTLLIDQEWFIPLRLEGLDYLGSSPKAIGSIIKATTCGWPSMWKDAYFNGLAPDARHHADAHKFHRMYEGPRKTRRYETATPITSGTETFKHNDITNDPVGVDGKDFELNNVGTLTDTAIAILTNDIDLKVSKGSFAGGEVSNPNYPRAVIDDKIKEAQDSKNATSLNETKTLTDYNRLNLLKDHFNNIAVHVKKADKIRPLAVDEIYFGNRKMNAGSGWFGEFLSADVRYAQMELYEGFDDGSDADQLYTDLGITVRTFADFNSASTIDAAASTTAPTSGSDTRTEAQKIDDYRWVKIDDVKAFATANNFGFRFEEIAQPAYFASSLTQTSGLTGSTLQSLSNTIIAALSGTGHAFKIRSTVGSIHGEHYATDLKYVPLSNSETETLGTSFYYEAGNFLNTGIAYKVIKSSTGIGTWGVTGLVVQVVDNVNDLNSYSRPSVRAKLAVKPLKKVELQIPSGGDIYDAVGADVAATASTQLVDITSTKQFFYPNDSRHRYAYLLNVTAPVTHSA